MSAACFRTGMGSVLSIINSTHRHLASLPVLVGLACAGAVLAEAPKAHAAAVTLLSAAEFDPTSGPLVGYDLLVGNQTAVTLGSASGGTFTASGGAIAQGTYSTSSNPDSFNNVTSGGFYEGRYGSGCSPTAGSSCTHAYTSSSTVGTITNNAALFNPLGSGIPNNNPIEDALSAAAQATMEGTHSYSGYSGTGTFNATNLGAFVCTTSSTCSTGSFANLTLTATTALADNVFNITSLDLENGACLTFSDGTAGSNARFVVNLTGPMTMKNAACINRDAGVGAQDIIFNVEGSGNAVDIEGGMSGQDHLSGTILAPSSNVTFNSATLTGEIISGLGSIGNSSYTLQANNSSVNFAAYTPPGRVPEPATVALFGTGLAAVAAIRKRREAKRS